RSSELGSIPFFAGSICRFGMKRGVAHRESAAGVRFPGFIAVQNNADSHVKYGTLYGVYRNSGIVVISGCEKLHRVNPRTGVLKHMANSIAFAIHDREKMGRILRSRYHRSLSIQIVASSCACSESISAPAR
ncbi:hypothetical protein, partial [Burkholderia ubonensis]|uniref:hypothetical protein n=1 Tax=Burkholderia ubonensis TaxID=101571 RepID=UPI001E4EE390